MIGRVVDSLWDWRCYFERTPLGSCPDPAATPVRLVAEQVREDGPWRRFEYFTRKQAEDMSTSLGLVLAREAAPVAQEQGE